MKAKSGYSGLERFPLFSGKRSEVFRVSGNDVQMSLINDLFDSGEEAEGRRLLRKTLHRITHDLDAVFADGNDARDNAVMEIGFEALLPDS